MTKRVDNPNWLMRSVGRNPVAKRLRQDPEFRPRLVESDRSYNRKKFNKNDLFRGDDE